VWVRGIIGAVLCLVGAVWVAQGTGAMRGSGMSGHGQYTALGVIVILIGLASLLWADQVRRRRNRPAS
jgi:predicted phage tail protein